MALTILLHDDACDDVFERLVQASQLLDAILEAARGPLANLSSKKYHRTELG